jgi:nicotinamidase-related amidase
MAVVVIDVQAEFFDTAPRPDQADQTVDRINALTTRARAEGVPVFFVQHEVPGGPLAFGSPGWALERRLRVEEGDHRIRKTTPDSFLRTGLEGVLSGLGVTRIVVCGYASEFCVDTTVRRAAALGYEVVLAADAHTTHDKPHARAAQIRIHHNATLPDITSFGPRIVAINEAAIQFRAQPRVGGPWRA